MYYSTEIEKYLELADQTGYDYLEENSKEIRMNMRINNYPIKVDKKEKGSYNWIVKIKL